MDSAHPVVPRILDLPALLADKSHFLLGPRQTGKSHLVRSLKAFLEALWGGAFAA